MGRVRVCRRVKQVESGVDQNGREWVDYGLVLAKPDNDRGRTHWEGCWKEPGHYECAMARVERLEDIAFERGAIEEPPCFCCGYNGEGYYDPEVHPCAERHHRLKWGNVEEEED